MPFRSPPSRRAPIVSPTSPARDLSPGKLYSARGPMSPGWCSISRRIPTLTVPTMNGAFRGIDGSFESSKDSASVGGWVLTPRACSDSSPGAPRVDPQQIPGDDPHPRAAGERQSLTAARWTRQRPQASRRDPVLARERCPGSTTPIPPPATNPGFKTNENSNATTTNGRRAKQPSVTTNQFSWIQGPFVSRPPAITNVT
jgi:hypothetical protein